MLRTAARAGRYAAVACQRRARRDLQQVTARRGALPLGDADNLWQATWRWWQRKHTGTCTTLSWTGATSLLLRNCPPQTTTYLCRWKTAQNCAAEHTGGRSVDGIRRRALDGLLRRRGWVRAEGFAHASGRSSVQCRNATPLCDYLLAEDRAACSPHAHFPLYRPIPLGENSL